MILQKIIDKATNIQEVNMGINRGSRVWGLENSEIMQKQRS